MEPKTPYSLKKLRSEFNSRVQKNQRYSLRAFARFLGIEAPSLSGILNGKRQVPKNKLDAVVKKLALSPSEAQLFKASVLNQSKKPFGQGQNIHELEFLLDDEAHFNLIAEWEHNALLSLLETKDFQHDPKWMAQRLGLSPARVQSCLLNLITGKLILHKDGQYTLNQVGTCTTEDIPSSALKKARRSDLQLAEAAIDDIATELRDLSSMTLTLNIDDLPHIKNEIRKFRKKIMKTAEKQPGEEVYKLSVQLIPVTKIENSRRSK